MTNIDKSFSIAHQLFDQYRTTISVLLGLGIVFFHLYLPLTNRYMFSNDLMVI